METIAEKLPAYTQQQIEDIGLREASKMAEVVRQWESNYSRVAEHLEDLAGAWIMGALTATKNLETSREGNRSYQWKSGRGEMLRRWKEIKAELSPDNVSIYATVEGGEEDSEEDNLLDTVADSKAETPAEIFGFKLNCEALPAAMALLDDEQREIIITRYVDGNTTEKTAELLGKCAARVCRREAEALAILRRELAA